ncbi:MAG: hypothetical protein AAFX06_10805, partial [Planctomycetota bacterium]
MARSERRQKLMSSPSRVTHQLIETDRIQEPDGIQFWLEFLDHAAKKANEATETLPESVRDCFEPCLLDALQRSSWSESSSSKAAKSLSRRLSKSPLPASPSGLFCYPSGQWIARLLQAWMGLPVSDQQTPGHPAAKLYEFAIDRWTNG